MSNRNGIVPTEHLTDKWTSFLQRISKCHIPSVGNGMEKGTTTIVKISFMLDERGDVIVWTKPKCTHIEPGSSNVLFAMMRDFTPD